ncbi:hypothetical protein KQX54_006826 [Cotesia glomerata]|uniref:Uncharacterized protein n=1 Tax=Cotesia glomerata TaxID=32391 RepID=A0AAV7IT62_COTGL|nr:hypothetical protein KQX54_006826 [Cotesia glomerata]
MENGESKKWWALVKWVGGEDNKKMTPGIDVCHIKDFSVDSFVDENHDPKTIYVVEWRDTKKEPLGCWNCYHAIVLEVSRSKKMLEKKLDALEGVVSPGPTIKLNSSPAAASKDDKTDKDNVSENELEIVERDNLYRDTDESVRKKLRFSSNVEIVTEAYVDSSGSQTHSNTKDCIDDPPTVSDQDSTKTTPSSAPGQYVTQEHLDKALSLVMMNLKKEAKNLSSLKPSTSTSDVKTTKNDCTKMVRIKNWVIKDPMSLSLKNSGMQQKARVHLLR